MSDAIRKPTAEECTNRSPLGGGWFAIWYPQMGGYSGMAAVYVGETLIGEPQRGCFEMLVWHDGEFPFGDGQQPVELHHCDPAQFIKFGQDVETLQSNKIYDCASCSLTALQGEGTQE